MRGISEQRLKELNNDINQVLRTTTYGTVYTLLEKECKELNEWKPIETAPKDRMILIWDDGYGCVAANWNAFWLCFTDMRGGRYVLATHWQELPEEPN